MSTALEAASLIMIPNSYSDGLLASVKPNDGAGDFTFSRGSNLSATRVNADGNIEKGYENLLLQSNSFSDAAWGGSSFNVIPNQEGYDGLTDAWLLETTTTGTSVRIQQSVSMSSIHTYSVYAKKGTSNWLVLRNNSNATAVWFDLENGVIGQENSASINPSIESIGDGWYRLSVLFDSSTSVRFYMTDGDDSYDATLGANVYIQDAMLNQGLVAYAYLETTTATVQGGLLENTPRLDWSNGVPAVLLEEERTNISPRSENFESFNTIGSPVITPNATISPEGVQNAYAISSTGGTGRVRSTNIPYENGAKYCISVYAKANGSYTFNLRHQEVNNFNVRFDLSDQSFTSLGLGNWFTDAEIIPFGNDGWYRCVVYITMDATPNTGTGEIVLYGGDSVYVYGFQTERGSTPSSYIPTYGTSQTRGSETISDNFNIPTTATIYNSFYSDVAETVFVLDQVFNVVVGLNKVAIAFSPTAVKISVGGSIVANATGTYDTSSLTNIQLGSDNGSDYSNAPISGFYVFPEFLTDEELNSLTA